MTQEPLRPSDVADAAAQPTAETAPIETDIEAELAQVKAKADENWTLYLRARADVDNMRRRYEREMENAQKYALERFIAALLPVQDGMAMGLDAINAGVADLESIKEGVRLTQKQLLTALEKFGVKEINPQGERFNPEWHEAVSAQEIAGATPDTVVAVMQKGYLLNERLIRPAMVVVAKAPA